jgi:hypothetical protein
MSKKKVPTPKVEKVTLYDFGFGLIDTEKAAFETLAKGIGLDPEDLANILTKKE